MIETRPRRVLPVVDPGLVPGEARPPRSPSDPADDRLLEYVPEARTLPAFHVWTLGCQMNKSDSEEMAGRLLAAGCAEATSMDVADLIVINTCAIREAAEAKVIGRQGHLATLKRGQPGPPRRPDRLLGPRARPRRARATLSGRRPVPPPGRGTRARRPARSRLRSGPDRRGRLGRGDDGRQPRPGVRRAAPLGDPGRGGPDGRRGPAQPDQRLAADHLRLRQDVHLLHRPVQPRTRAEPSVRRHPRGGSRPRRRRRDRGDPARPERELVRPRPAARGALRPCPRGPQRRPADRPRRAARPGRADPGDRRPSDRRWPPGDPTPALHHEPSMGPVRPAHRGAGRVPVGLRGAPPARPERRRRDAPADGPPILDRTTTRSAWRGSAMPSRASPSRPT